MLAIYKERIMMLSFLIQPVYNRYRHLLRTDFNDKLANASQYIVDTAIYYDNVTVNTSHTHTYTMKKEPVTSNKQQRDRYCERASDSLRREKEGGRDNQELTTGRALGEGFGIPNRPPDPLTRRAGRDPPFPLCAGSLWRERDIARRVGHG
jgi:hypothetical protein